MREYKSRQEAISDHQQNYRSQGGLKDKFKPDGPDKERIGKIVDEVQESSVVLDVGCNDGSLGRMLVARDCVVFGVDVVSELVNIAKSRGLLARVCCAEELPYKDETFDAVICAETLEHLFNPEDGIKECARVVKSSGIFIGSVPHADGGLGRKHRSGGDYHQTLFETEYLVKLLHKYFKKITISPTPYNKDWCDKFNVDYMHQWNNFKCMERI